MRGRKKRSLDWRSHVDDRLTWREKSPGDIRDLRTMYWEEVRDRAVMHVMARDCEVCS